MPQSATITIKDKQRPYPTGPWQVETTKGDRFKAWRDVGNVLQAGGTYSVTWDMKQGKNPEYPPEATIITAVTQIAPMATAKSNGSASQSQEHWDEVDIRRHTVSIYAVERQLRPDIDRGQLLDECRADWVAHISRSQTPTVKRITKEELMTQEDWTEFK